MTDKFANLYWSSDYKTGIDRIRDQTFRSIEQIHELRRLVFNYMNYFHSNSQQLNKLSIETYTPSSSLRPYNDNSYEASIESRLKTTQLGSPFKFRSVSQANRQLAEVKQMQKKANPECSTKVSASFLFEKYVDEMTADSHNLLILASMIEREVLEKISHFTKTREPRLRSIINSFEELFQNYDSKYKEVEKLKEAYEEYKKMIELSEGRDVLKNDNEMTDRNSSDSSDHISKEESYDASDLNSVASEDSLSDSQFDFPLQVGPLKLKNEEQLSSLISNLINNIPTKKKRIIIPGYRNEIFNSDSLCYYLKTARPFGIDPIRSNLEKFGQNLLDLKLAVGTSFIGSRKFKGEGLWLEWTDLAMYTSRFEDEDNLDVKEPNEGYDDENASSYLEEHASKSMNQMALNASKRFNGIFKNVTTSLLKKNYPELLKETEEKYNEGYFECQDLRHFLDLELQNKLQILEEFEKRKIELIYQSLTKLSELLYNFSLNSSSRLHKFATEFINEYSIKQNYAGDFNKLLEDFSTGIYSPSVISPDNLHKKHFSTNQSNNNYQNLRYQFNLYRDIPLQPQVHDSSENPNKLLSLVSIPQFLFKILTLVEINSNDNEEDMGKYWIAPIDHQNHWMIKEQLIQIISEFEPRKDIESIQESSFHDQILTNIIEHLKTKEMFQLINFVKNWLLQLSESLIPCIAFDSLMKVYGNSESMDEVDRYNEIVRILSAIPRSNFSALIFLLEHISIAFNIAQIPNYKISDELSEDLIQYDEPQSIKDLSIELNSMDTIGAIPFIHIILKPYPVKSAAGFKPPLDSYNNLLFDLLNVKLRCQLFKSLVEAEQKYKDKKDKETGIFPLKKSIQFAAQKQLASANLSIPKSPRPSSSGSDNFVLRQFRTGQTPIPSPSASPRHSKVNSTDELHVPKTRKSGTPTKEVRTRSSSLTFLTPEINVEFEKK